VEPPRTIYYESEHYYIQPPETVYLQPAPNFGNNNANGAAPPPISYWYFCAAANAYYPYVTSCQGGWQSVPTTPPDVLQSMPYGAPPR
jgi:hypothetical protein